MSTFDAEQAENLEEVWALAAAEEANGKIEMQFAVKAVEHAQIYWALLQSRKASTLSLTKIDSEILEDLEASFPELKEHDAVDVIDENEMKSPEGKRRWREFMMRYAERQEVQDYSFGTLLRTSARAEYEEKTTIFVPRMQFLAIEIARNRRGLNDWICK